MSAFIESGHTISSVKVNLPVRLRLEAIWRYLQAPVLLILDDVLRSVSAAARGTPTPTTRAAQEVAELALDPIGYLLALADHISSEFIASASNIAGEKFGHLLCSTSGKVADLLHHIFAILEEELCPSQPRFASQFLVPKLEDTLDLSVGTSQLRFSLEADASSVHEESNALAGRKGDAATGICTCHIQQSSNLTQDGVHDALHEGP